MIKFAICDDVKKDRDVIEDMIFEREDSQSFAVEKFSCGDELLQSKTKFDIVFLDIELKDSLGVDVAQKIRENNKDIIIFFVTGYTRYISEAFRSMPFQYIIKPIDKKLLNEEVDRAIKILLAKKDSLSISWNKQTIMLPIKDIAYLERYSRKIKFKMINGEENLCGGRLSDYEIILKPYQFIRIHNSFLLNLRCLKKIEAYNAVLRSGEGLPISKKYIKDLRMKFAEKISGVRI